MKIEFYDLESGEVYNTDDYYFFVDSEGDVMEDNGQSYESQYQTVDFDTFVNLRIDVGWRVIIEEAGE